VSGHVVRIFRRVTLASSFNTCTLITPPWRMIVSARSAFTGSLEAIESRTLVSKKLSAARLVPVELEVGRQAAAISAKPLQQFITAGFVRDGECPCIGDMNFDLVAFLKFERFDHGGRNSGGQYLSSLILR
jgi:hypothetical protein